MNVINDDGKISWFAFHTNLLFSDFTDLVGVAIWNKSPLVRYVDQTIKKPSQGGLDASPAWLLVGATSASAIHLAREAGWLGRQPNS
jgi:hypothetical protein